MGVDLALLANNHVYDYGKDAMLDTLDTLTNADIKYFGAGANLEEAMKPDIAQQNIKSALASAHLETLIG